MNTDKPQFKPKLFHTDINFRVWDGLKMKYYSKDNLHEYIPSDNDIVMPKIGGYYVGDKYLAGDVLHQDAFSPHKVRVFCEVSGDIGHSRISSEFNLLKPIPTSFYDQHIGNVFENGYEDCIDTPKDVI